MLRHEGGKTIQKFLNYGKQTFWQYVNFERTNIYKLLSQDKRNSRILNFSAYQLILFEKLLHFHEIKTIEYNHRSNWVPIEYGNEARQESVDFDELERLICTRNTLER